MPSLGADMEDGTLTEWRVQPGSAIHRGQVVALVETAKGIIDIESFEDAVVERLLVEPGATVPVGAPLALLAGEATAVAAGPPGPVSAAAPAVAPAAVAAAPAAAPSSTAAAAPAVARSSGRVSPAARALAAKLGVDVAALKGSGPEGAVGLADVQAAASPRAGMRVAIGAALGRSKREIPHYYIQHSMDFTPAANWLADYNAPRPVPERLLPMALLIRAVARAAAERPGFNGYYQNQSFAAAAAVHLGVAIALRGGGLVAPAILDAGGKSPAELMGELQQLVARVRGGHMRSGELSAGTITVTSLGEEGVEALLPIIYPPQVAIVGFGSPLVRPWVVDGQVAVRTVLHISLAADHRVSDGRQGAQFVMHIAELLSRPGEL